jgi:thiol-disulfide isomerase/thioredoxin
MRFFWIILFGITSSCGFDNEKSISAFELEAISDSKSWAEIISNEHKILYFLSPECPLSQNYSRTIIDLSQKFNNDSINFIMIFPGKEYSTKEIKAFLIKYKLDFPSYLDSDFSLTKTLNAEITPEAFLLDNSNSVLYSGAIDNWAISLGQKRSVISANYLSDALESALKGEEISIKETKAVGCFIQ